MARNRSKKQVLKDPVEGFQARSRRWYPRRVEFTVDEREALADSADLDLESKAGELFVEAVAVLCGSLPGRADAVDVGRPGAATREELEALETAILTALDSLRHVSARMLALSAAARERLALVVGGPEPAGSKALWKVSERFNSEIGSLQLRGSLLFELAGAAREAADAGRGEGQGRPRERAKSETIKELANVFQHVHRRSAGELDKAFGHFFLLLRPILDGEQSRLALEYSEADSDAAYQWCRTHRVPRLRKRLELDDATLEACLRTISPAFTADRVVSATDFDAEYTAHVNTFLASERPGTEDDE